MHKGTNVDGAKTHGEISMDFWMNGSGGISIFFHPTGTWNKNISINTRVISGTIKILVRI